MNDKTDTPQLPSLNVTTVRLAGTVNDDMLRDFLTQLDRAVAADGPIVVELSTTGGDADIGRRMALEIRLLRERGSHELYFFGKSTVYSAGVTLMSAFPVERRFVSADISLLIHERRMDKELKLSGALRGSIAVIKDLLAQLEHGQLLERDGFADLVRGSSLSLDAVMARVMDANWYLRGPEALSLGLVAALV